MTVSLRRLRPAAPTLALALMVSACMVGPDYKRPGVSTPPAFKEAPNAQNAWNPTQPMDTIDRGAWWSAFGDPVLDGLEQKVRVSNQNVAEAVAAYDQARALTAADRAGFFPTLSATGSGTRSGGGGGNRSVVTTGGTVAPSGSGSYAVSTYGASLGASWAPDVWGRLRRQVQSDVASAQASAADLANATLSGQAELAIDYLTLRILDEEKRLFDDTVAADKRAYDITVNKYHAGTAAKTDVITAQTQFLAAQASDIDIGVQRAQTEHAIAVLAGMAPAELAIAVLPKLNQAVPTPPQVVPSVLLQRRPDIAAAERKAASASALIGVQVAAYYPTLSLTGSFGYDSSSIGKLFNAANDVWSYGGSAADTLLDFGARQAKVREAKAAYAESVAAYRQTVLAAFQQVEDELVALRVLEQEAKVRDQALASARQALELTINEYKAGTVDYTSVVTAQNTALSAAQSVLTVLQSRQTASVTLIEALGGGWTSADLPKR
jgi:NodT family efflux transporter outer membrane factor (OMF) lipoprotein